MAHVLAHVFMSDLFGVEVVHDSPLSQKRWGIMIHYRNLSDEGVDFDEFRQMCFAVADEGGERELLVQLGTIKHELESSLAELIDRDVLLNNINEWRKVRSANPFNKYGERNIHLDMPIELWIDTAWTFINQFLEIVTDIVQQLLTRNSTAVERSDHLPPLSLSPLAKLLFPLKAEFITPLTEVAYIIRTRRGTIEMSSSTKSIGALILETIRIGLGIENPKELREVFVCFPNAIKVSEGHEPKPWFDKNNALANLVNTTRRGTKPHVSFVRMDDRMKLLVVQIRAMIANLDKDGTY